MLKQSHNVVSTRKDKKNSNYHYRNNIIQQIKTSTIYKLVQISSELVDSMHYLWFGWKGAGDCTTIHIYFFANPN